MTYDNWKTTMPDEEPPASCPACGEYECRCPDEPTEQTRVEREEGEPMHDALKQTIDNMRATFGLRTPEQLSEDAITIAHRISGATEALLALRLELEIVRGRVGDTVPAGEEQQMWKRELLGACMCQIEQLDAAIAALGVKR